MISLIVGLIVVGLLLWAVETLVPLDPTIRRVIHVVVIVAVCLWLLRYFAMI